MLNGESIIAKARCGWRVNKGDLIPRYNNRDFKILHEGRLGRLDAYTGDLGRVR